MHSYPGGITREEFEIIRADIESARKTTKLRKIDMYDVFCWLLYLLKDGCRRRIIPADFPKWNTIYFYYGIRSEKKGKAPSVLEKALKKLVLMPRNQELRRDKTSLTRAKTSGGGGISRQTPAAFRTRFT
jgi:transposase